VYILSRILHCFADDPCRTILELCRRAVSLGEPDTVLRTMTELLAAARSMTASVRIPVVADCDTGHRSPHDLNRLVGIYEAAGVAAVCLAERVVPDGRHRRAEPSGTSSSAGSPRPRTPSAPSTSW